MAARSVAHCEILALPVAQGVVRAMVICLNTPDSSQNIIDRSFCFEFGKAVMLAVELARGDAIDLLVVCSGKSNGFIAGADINYLLSYTGHSGCIKTLVDANKINYVYCSLETLPVPTVAVINGTVLGAGLELVMSCDYRVISAGAGQQIGLPEVKIGVLPGAGGCFRLPYLVGLRHALPMIVSGSSISAKKALKLGLVDMLWTHTQSVDTAPNSEGGSGRRYSYEWVSELTKCIDAGRIGKKLFNCPNDLSTKHQQQRPLELSDYPLLLPVKDISEEDLFEKADFSWAECEEKAMKKFKYRSAVNHTFLSPLYYVMDSLMFLVTAVQVERKVGRTIPSPYSALLCTWRCYNMASIKEGVAECSSGFAHLVETAESKALMSLFLLARKLKKKSVGVTEGVVSPTEVIVTISGSKDGFGHIAKFVQSLLYSDIKVGVVFSDGEGNEGVWQRLVNAIEKLFQYSVSKGYMTKQVVSEKIKGLRRLSSLPPEGNNTALIINADSNNSTSSDIKPSCCYISLYEPNNEGGGGGGGGGREGTVLLHLGDPLRKNTHSIEIMSDNQGMTAKMVSKVALIVDKLGKVPVVTPACSNIGWKLAIAHWSLAVQVTMEMGVGMDYLERVLKDGGFSEGPFTTMKKMDKDVLSWAVKRFSHDDKLLAEYAKHPASIRNRTTPSRPQSQSVLKIFIVNIVLTATQLLSDYEGTLSADALDFLCVSGLVHFPPTEGGPINYLKRNGRGLLVDQLRDLSCSGNPKLKEFAASLVERLNQAVFPGNTLSLLSDEELARVGPTHGMQHLESLLHPFPFNAHFLYFILLAILILMFALIIFIAV